jgi:hypothetical protein
LNVGVNLTAVTYDGQHSEGRYGSILTAAEAAGHGDHHRNEYPTTASLTDVGARPLVLAIAAALLTWIALTA